MKKKTKSSCLEIEGELNIFTAAAVRERLLALIGDGADVEIDLSKVTEIDSAGVQLMVAAKREAAARKGRLRFAGHSAAVVDVVDLCDLSGYFGDPVLLHPSA